MWLAGGKKHNEKEKKMDGMREKKARQQASIP
jgi:hypothetical protein